MKPSEFIKVIKQEIDLSQNEEQLILSTQINNYEELWSLLSTFSSLSKSANIGIPKLTNLAAKRINSMFSAATLPGKYPRVASYPARGTYAPPKAPIKRVAKAPFIVSSAPVSKSGGSTGSKKTIDFRLPSWPVKDQGDRGTCVSFATIACREYQAHISLGKNAQALSEQFFYWAVKKKSPDPDPDVDGTLLEYARIAMENEGSCEPNFWPYDGTFIPGNITHEKSGVNPSKAAEYNAKQWSHPIDFYMLGKKKGNSQILYDLLENNQRPVAVSIPVFVDPITKQNNWDNQYSQFCGKVGDPVPTSYAHWGHAVCMTGFTADDNEAMGGYFIFRNSWGTGWSVDVNAPEHYGKELGYGYISASYIDSYTWEIAAII